MHRSVLDVGVAGVIATVAGLAQAQTATDTFQVTATVVAECSVTASDLAFGSYSSLAPGATDGTSTVTVTCTLDTPYNVGLGDGANFSAGTRHMRSAATVDLTYALYQDAARTQVWDSVDLVAGTGTGGPVDHVVYGQIPAGQAVQAGGYADTVTVTVDY